MRRRIGTLALLFTLIATPALAEVSATTIQFTEEITHQLNGVIQEGTTYITAHTASEAFDAKLEFNNANDEITFIKDNRKIVMTIGLRTVTVNGQRSLLKSPIWLNEKGETMVPMKILAEQLGYYVSWNDDLNQVGVSEYLPYNVLEGDTVESLTEKYEVTIEAFMEANKTVQGISGLTPRSIIFIPVKQTPPKLDTSSVLQYSDKDLDMLARIIYCESHGEPFDGQVAVGGVIMNRVESSAYPDTVKSVIYQNYKGNYQFGPVKTGKINEIKPDKDAIKAAKAALEGQDPSKGGLVFYNPRITTSSWFTKKAKTARIGNHVFAK